MNRKQKRSLLMILISAALYIAALLIPSEGWLRALIFLAPYGVIAYRQLFKAFKNILQGQVFDEVFLMCVASVAAFCAGEYAEGVAVMLFFQVGELFESCAVGKSRRSIASLMDIRPDCAHVLRNGETITVEPDEVGIGEVIIVHPGERIPLDGTVTEGNTTLDTAALTGESVPREALPGDNVISGCINLSGANKVSVSRAYGESTVEKILELVENASSRKAKSESFITKFARWYTPAVCIGALLLAVVPSIITGNWNEWISRALIFLVVSCPCALVISVPLSFFGGIGGASANGILIKGGNYMEALAKAECVAFDKTGTLTEGSFEVASVNPSGVTAGELLETAAMAEYYSLHPISRSLMKAYAAEIDENRIADYSEIAGRGVSAKIDGMEVLAGNIRLMHENGVGCETVSAAGTVVYAAKAGEYIGHIVISDKIKPGAAEAIGKIRESGVRKIVMLTGDKTEVAAKTAEALGISEFHAEMLPEDKVRCVESMIAEAKKGTLIFAGDGINDAPVLARADVGVAMGALGSDAAIEAADVVLMDDNPAKIASAIKIAKKTLAIVRQNIVFALGVKLLVLILGAFGKANMFGAVFADVGVSVIAILNAMRALKKVK
ncbi:MAG: cadmium-translocating P-type ATPase [Clostridia bacterium]|nr:cadmium-translocating P-type ATPase [Clostridia bacterium]